MKNNEFRGKLITLIDNAIAQELSRDRIVEILQQEAQNVQEKSRVYTEYIYECPETNCKESTTQLINYMNTQCDICIKETVETFEPPRDGNRDKIKFFCEDHGLVYVHDFSPETTCPIHDNLMKLVASQTIKKEI